MDVLGLSSQESLRLTTAILRLGNLPVTLSVKELKEHKAEFLKLVQGLKAEWRKDVEEAIKSIDRRIAPTVNKAPGWNNAELSD